MKADAPNPRDTGHPNTFSKSQTERSYSYSEYRVR